MKPRYIATLIALTAAMSIGTAIADNTVRLPSAAAVTNIGNHIPLLLAPVIKDVKYVCGNPSSSSVIGTLVNKNTTPQTYTPVFKGQKLNQCVEYYPVDCSGMPAGSLCIPTKCKTTKPGEFVTIKGSPVVVPANGQKQASIGVPNTDFQSATLNVGTVKANVAPLPHSCIF
ncbi:MAG: hypothetical protein PHE17_04820 [Thiothrix sp.]|uniref:hypothetical protein n=1 Tax=Thiothrix sp. TaxID=1032 RepID=UPI002634BE7F|nr:hypothetical protein [Thiothrix sp.]MDD5392322.1 hypothetical protein [Thiothrix sp.]